MSQEIELIGNIINKMQQAFNQVGLLVRDYQQRTKMKKKSQNSHSTDLLLTDKIKGTKKIREKKDKIKHGVEVELINDCDKPKANKQKPKQVYTYDFDEQNKPNPILPPPQSQPQITQLAQLPQQPPQPSTSKQKPPKISRTKTKKQKKLTNPFTLFIRQQKQVLRQVYPKLEGTQFMQTMGKLWKQLQPTEREFYINKFQQIRALKKMEENGNRIIIDQ